MLSALTILVTGLLVGCKIDGSGVVNESVDVGIVADIIDLAGVLINYHERKLLCIELTHINFSVAVVIPQVVFDRVVARFAVTNHTRLSIFLFCKGRSQNIADLPNTASLLFLLTLRGRGALFRILGGIRLSC